MFTTVLMEAAYVPACRRLYRALRQMSFAASLLVCLSLETQKAKTMSLALLNGRIFLCAYHFGPSCIGMDDLTPASN